MIVAKILDFSLDPMVGYVVVTIEYSINGTKKVNPHRIDFRNMIGKNLAEITEYIDGCINFQIDRYIESDFRKKINTVFIEKTLGVLIGKEYVKESADIEVNDKILTVKPDGTYLTKA